MNKQQRNEHINPADRPAELDELNFENDKPTPGFGFENEETPPTNDPSARKAGLTEASQPGQGPTNDEATPETLILEDGARSQFEAEHGNLEPADKTLTIVNGDEIGAGDGLDQAELADVEPEAQRSA